MKIFVIVVYLLNATSGDVEQEYVSAVPMTAEGCLTELSKRGPVPVKDGLATFAFCRRIEAKAAI